MRILVLILASDGNPEYVQFQEIWRMYTKSHPHIDCLFYKGNPSMEKAAELIGDTVYVKIEDTLDTVYDKLMMTLRFMYDRFDNYDFLFRTNLSSYIEFDKYFKFCSTLPSKNCCAAVLGNHDGILFPSGAGFTLSIDLAKRFVNENPPAVFLDDVSVGSALAKWGVQYIRVNRIDYIGNRSWRTEHPQLPGEILFHYRVKSNNRKHDYLILSDLVRTNGLQ